MRSPISILARKGWFAILGIVLSGALAFGQGTVRWVGTTSNAWAVASNWAVVSGTPSTPPGSGDAVELGTGAITTQPTITTSPTIASLTYGNFVASTLTISSGGNLTVTGAITNTITGTGRAHNITLASGVVLTAGSANLSPGVTGANMTITFNGGTFNVLGNFTAQPSVTTNTITLTVTTGTFTVGGTTLQGAGGGTARNCVISATTGTLSFAGPYTKDGSGSNLTTTGAANVSFGSSVTNTTGTFTLNAATTTTFTGSGNVTPTVAMTFGHVSLNTGVTTTTVSAAGTLTIAGNLDLNGTAELAGTETVLLTGTGTSTIDGTGTISAPITVSAAHTIPATANLTISGAMSMNGTAGDINNSGVVTATSINGNAAGATWTQSAGTAQLHYNGTTQALLTTGTLTATMSGNLVEYGGAGNQTVKAVDYYNLTLSGSGTKTLAAATNLITGNFTMSGSAAATGVVAMVISGNVELGGTSSFTSGTFTHTVAGNWIVDGGTFTGGAGTVSFTGTGPDTIIVNPGPLTFNNLTINKTAATDTVYLGANVSVAGNLTVTNGVYDLGSYTSDRTAAGGTLSIAGANDELRIGGTNSLPANFSTITLNAASIVEYYGTDQTVSATTYGILELNGSGSTKSTPTGTTTTIVAGNFTNNAGVTYEAAAGAAATLTLQGTTNVNSGTLGSSANPFTTINVGNAGTDGLTNSASIGDINTGTLAITGVLTNNNTVTATTALSGTGTFSNATAASILNVGGTSVITALTATAAGNTVNYYSTTAAATIKGTTYHHLIFNKSGVTSTLGAATTVNGDLTVTAGMLNTNNLGLSVSGTTSLDGTLGITAGTTGTIAFDTLTVNGTGIFNNNTVNDAVTINGSLTNNGAFNAGTGVYTLTAASAAGQTIAGTVAIPSLTVNGTYSNTGTLTVATALAGSSTLTNTADATLNIGGTSGITGLDASSAGNTVNYYSATAAATIKGTTYHHLIFNKSGVTSVIGAATTVNGNLTVTAGILNTNNLGLSVSGTTSVDGTLGITTGTAGAIAFDTLTVNGTGIFNNTAFNDAVTIDGSLTNSGTFNAGSGVYTLTGASGGTQTITGTLSISSLTVDGTYSNAGTLTIAAALAGGGTLTQANGSTLNLGGTVTVATLNASTNSNLVNFNGTGSQTIPAQNFYNLTSSSTGARVLASSGSIGVAGTFTPGANSYTITGSTIDFNGSGTQTIPAFNYNNLTSSNSGARTLASSGTIGVAGTLIPGTNSYTNTSSTINFNGSGTQTIPAFNYNNLTSSSTGGRTLASSGSIGVAGTFTPGANAYTITGSTVDFNGSGTQTIPAFNYNNLTSTSSGARTLASGGTIGVAGVFTPGSNSFTITGSTISYNGTVSQSVAAFNYNSLTIANTTVAVMANSNFNVAGTLTVNANAILSPAAAVVVGGAGTLTGSGTVQVTRTTGTPDFLNQYAVATHDLSSLTVDYYSTSAQTISAIDYYNLTISGSRGANSVTLPGSGTIGIGGVFNPSASFSGGGYIKTSSTIDYNGTFAQTAAAFTYEYLSISNSAGVAMGGNVTVDSVLSLATGAFSIGVHTLTLNGGPISVIGGSLTGGSASSLEMNGGTYTSTFIPSTITALKDLKINAAPTSNKVTHNGQLTLSGVLTLTNGIFDNMPSAGDTLILDATSSVNRIGGRVRGAIRRWVPTGSPSVYYPVGGNDLITPVTLNFSSVSIAGWVTVRMYFGDHGSIATSGIDATKSVNRNYGIFPNGLAATSVDATIGYGGVPPDDMDAGATPANFIVRRNDGANWFKTTVGLRTDTSTAATGLPITQTNTYQVGEQLVKTWDGGASTSNWGDAANWAPDGVPSALEDVNLSSGNTININVAATANSLTINNSGALLTILSGNSLTVAANLSLVSGTLNTQAAFPTVSGTTTISGGTVGYTASSGSQTVLVQSYNNLTISGGGTKTLNGTITPSGDLTVSGGVFDLGSYTANRSSSGGTLTIANGAGLKIGGTTSFASNYSTHSIGATSTVEYSGSSQAIGVLNSTQSYGHLTLSGSGTKTFPSGTTGISGDLTNSVTIDATANSTTIDFNGGVPQAVAAANYHNLTFSNAGTKTFASGTSKIRNTFTISGTASGNATTNSATIEYNGTSSQVAQALTYYRLTVNNAAGVSIPGDVTVNNLLTLTSGNLNTGSYTLTIASTANVSRTSGYIIGKLAKTVSGTAMTPTFEIGDATAYTPVSFTFASVSVAGTLTVSTTPGDHFQIVTSGINSSKSVNRYWTLTNSGINFTSYTVGFKFVAGDIDGGANTAAFIVAEYNGSSWTLPTVGAKGADSTQATNLTSFGDFQLGEAATGGIKTWDGGAGTSNWGDGANWSPDGVPLSTDDVNLDGANTINVNVAAVCNSITLNHVSLVLTVLSGNTLSASGNLTLTNGTLNTEQAFPSVSGTISITGGTVGYTLTGGSQTVSALTYNNLTLSGTSTKTMSAGTTAIAGNFTVSGGTTDATANSTTINFNGSGSQAVAAIDYYNLTFTSTGTRTFATGTTGIAGVFSITGGTTDAIANSSTIDYKGSGAQTISAINYHNLNLSNAGVKTFASGTSGIANALTISGATADASANSPTVAFNGSGAQTVNALSYYHLTLGNAGTKTFAPGTTSIAGDFVLSGTATGNGTTNSTTININGSGAQAVAAIAYNVLNFSGGSTKTFGTGTATIASDFTIVGGTTGNATTNSMTIDFSGGVAQALPAMNYYILALSNAGVKTLASGTTGVANTFTITGSASLNATANSTTVDINGGGAQTIPAASYYHLTVSNAGTKTFATGTTTIAGNFTVSGGATANGTTNSTTIDFNGGGAQALGAINYYNITLSNAGTKTFASGTSRIAGAFTITGSASADVTSNTPTIEYNGSSSQTVRALTYQNLTVNNPSGVSIPGNVTVDGTLTFTSGTVTTGTFRVTVSSTGSVTRTSGHVVGNFEKYIPTIVPTRTFEVGDASSYTPVTVAFASVSTGGYLTVKTTSTDHPNIGTASMDANLTANRYWTLTGGPASFTNYSVTFTFVAGDLDVGAVPTNFIVGRYYSSAWSYPTLGTRTGTTTQATGLTLFGDFQLGEQIGTTQTWVGLSGDLQWNTAANWSNGTVPITTDNINLTVDSSITVNSSAVCKNLTMNSSGLVLTVSTGNSLTLSGNFTMTNGRLLTQVAFPSVAGSVTLNGGTVEYSAAGGQTISAQTYNKLTLSGSGNKSAAGNLTVNDSLLVTSAAVFDAGTSLTHTLKGNFVLNTSAGTPFIFTTGNTINFNTPGTPAARSLGGSTSATIAFNAINFNNTSGFIDSLNFSASGTVTVASGVVLTPAASRIISGSGTLTGNGTVQVTRTAATADFNSQYSISNKTLTNLTVEYAASGQVLSNLTYGGLKISGSISGAVTNTAAVGGAFNVTGTFNPTLGTITMNAGSSIVNSGTLAFAGLTIANSATVTTSSSFSVGGVLSVGTSAFFAPSAGTITMTGGSIANSGTLTFKALTIAASATVTSSSSFSVGGALTIGASSNFSPSSGTITLTNGASIANSGTLGFSGLTIAASATVTTSSSFSVGAALTVGSGAVFSPSAGTVTLSSGSSISNSGTLSFTTLTTISNAVITASGNFTVTADLTLVGATGSLTSTGNITVNGNVTNPNSITGAGTIILTGGASAHTLTGGSYSNMTVNDAFGVTLSTNVSVIGILTLTSGNITTGANVLTITSTGSTSRTSGHVVGSLAKYVATGTNVLRKFDIGTGANYTPVTLTFASVSVAGTLTATTTASDHPNISSAAIDPSNTANRYWTLTKDGTLAFTTYTSTFRFVAGDVDGGADPTQFIVGKYLASNWKYPTVGSAYTDSLYATGIDSVGAFQLGMQFGGTFTSAASGNWNTAATWTPAQVPGLNANVVIAAGHTVTLDVNSAVLSSVSIASTAVLNGGGAYTLTLGAGDGSVDFNNNGTFSAGSVTVKLNANSKWGGAGAFNLKNIDLNSRTLTLDDAVTDTLHLSGSGDPFVNTGTLVPGTNWTVDYNGTSGQSISSASTINFKHLRITNSATVTLQKNLTATNLTGNLTITSGGVLNTANGVTAFDITGNSATLTVDASSTLNLGGVGSAASSFPSGFTTVTLNTGSTVQYSNSSSASQTVAARSYDNILFSGSTTKSLGSGSLSVAGNWTNNATGGSLNTGTSTVTLTGSGKSIAGTAGTTFATLNVSGTYTNSATTTINTALGGAGSLTQAASATLNLNFSGSIGLTTLDASASGNTVNYQYAGSQTVRAMNHVNLTLSGSGTKTLSSGTTGISSLLTISGVTVDAITNGSTVNYNGSGSQNIAALGYYNLSLSNAGTKTFPTGTTSIAGALSVAGATADATTNNTTIDFNGTAAQTVGTTFDYNNLTISGNKGGQTVTLTSGTIGVKGNFSVTATNAVYTTTGNTIDFNGLGAQTIGAFNYNNLTISGNKNSNAITLASGTVGVAGTFSVTATNATYSMTGNTLDFNGTGAQTVGTFNYNNLTISGNKGSQTVTLASGTVGVAGAFSVTATNASYSTTGNTIDFNGAGSQTVGVFNYNNLTLSGDKGGQTVTLASGTIGVTGVFNPTATNASYTITGNTIDFNSGGSQSIPAFTYNNLTSSSTGARTLASSGTVGIAGTFTPGSNAYTITGSTIDFNGGTQTIPSFNGGTGYNNLSTSGASSTKTLGGAINVSGNFANGTSVATNVSTLALSITGTKTNGGTMQFAGASNGILFTDGTVEYNGTAAQAPAGQTVVLGIYNNLVFTNDAVKSISGGTVRTQSSLSIDSGISVIVSGTGILTVDLDLTLIGSFTNNGTVNAGN